MAYTNTWNAAEEAAPAATDLVSLGDDQIRNLKLNIRERMAKDHYMDIAGTDADHGEHQKITFHSQIAKPSNVANKAFLYIKDASSKTELFWEDEDGNELQMTSGGALAGGIPSGTKMLFYQDTAPTGWTINNTLDDKLLFVTKGSAAGGQTGGGAHSTGSWTISGIAVDSHVLTTAEMPAHTHTVPHANSTSVGPYWPGSNAIVPGTTTSSSTGGGGGHTHGVTVTAGWRPAAYCAIIATKD
jgi:hypothetical protein